MEVEISLPPFTRSETKIRRLKGLLLVIGASSMLRFTFDDLAIVKSTQEKVTVAIARLSVKGDPWTLQVELTYPPGGPRFESYQSWLTQNQIALVSKDGKRRLAPSGQSVDRLTDAGAVVTYYFAESREQPRGKPADWRLEYVTPAPLREVQVPYEFKEVPLP